MAEKKPLEKKLMEAMKSMSNPSKSKTAKVPTRNGREYSYSYESLEEVLGIVRPALMDNDLALVQGVKWHEPTNGFVLETGVMDESESRVLDVRPMPSCSDAQAEGSWETYKRRYALRTAFGLTGEDDDGAATKGAKTQNPASNRKSGASGDVLSGAKVTEMASDALMGKLDAKVEELAKLKGKPIEEVKDALMKSRTMQGAGPYESLTKPQANDALCLLVQWVDKANLHDEDVEF